MERKRIGAVVAVVIIVIVVVVAGWVLFLRPEAPAPPASDSVVLRVLGVADLSADSYGHSAAAGNTFLAVNIHVSSNLSAAVTLRNGSFSVDANQTTYSGNLTHPGPRSLGAFAAGDVPVYFELPSSSMTARIRLSESTARGSVAFVRQVVVGGPHTLGLNIIRSPDEMNWSVELTSVPPGLMPSSTYVQIRNSTGGVLLSKVQFSALTAAAWNTYEAEYVDNNPSNAALLPADVLLSDRATYPTGSVLEISDFVGPLATRSLI